MKRASAGKEPAVKAFETKEARVTNFEQGGFRFPLHVITLVRRSEALPLIRASLIAARVRVGWRSSDLTWHVILAPDSVALTGTLGLYLDRLPDAKWYVSPNASSGATAFGADQGLLLANRALDEIRNGYVWFLEGDNICAPDFLTAVAEAVFANAGAAGFAFGRIPPNGRTESADAMGRGEVDLAQCVLRRDSIGDIRFASGDPDADAAFLSRVFHRNKSDGSDSAERPNGGFTFIPESVTYHAYLRSGEGARCLESAVTFADRAALPGHLGGHFQLTNMDEPVLSHLIQRFRPAAFLDLGCGPGGMVLAARNRGLESLGIDGDATVAPDIVHDFTIGGIPLAILPPLPRPVLLWCVEFVEHVHERYLPNLLTAFERADVIFLTHAVPGQGGHHHVNERPATYWLGVLAAIGFEIDEAASIACRAIAVNQYTRATGLVFVKR